MGKTRLQVRTLEYAGFAGVFNALRLPHGLNCRSKVFFDEFGMHPGHLGYAVDANLEPKDMDLMKRLILAGDEHAKVLRGLIVWVEISAPVWFYRELETYNVGRQRLSSESTMHIECKGLEGEKLQEAKDKIPMGHIQKTVDMISYQTLRRIYFQRRSHRLQVWREFYEWIKSLPFANELITIERDGGVD